MKIRKVHIGQRPVKFSIERKDFSEIVLVDRDEKAAPNVPRKRGTKVSRAAGQRMPKIDPLLLFFEETRRV